MTPLLWRARPGILVLLSCLLAGVASAQIGTRFSSEKKIVPDPVTGVPLTFLTSEPRGDSKIYQTHPQWTADGEWLIFRSRRVPGEAMAVHEGTGDLVQVSEGGYIGMLVIARQAMQLYLMRPLGEGPAADRQIMVVDLARLLADSAAGTLAGRETYERVVGRVPGEWGAGGDMALDADERTIYFRFGREMAARLAPADLVPEANFGPRNMGAGPTGIAAMDLATGAIRPVTVVPFQAGHIQTNPWVPGEIVFCWETGGNAPQRMWIVTADEGVARPLYHESNYEWITHEAIITRDEVAFAVMGHRRPGTVDEWGIAGTREKPTGLGIINLRTGEMRMEAQTKAGSGLWHVHGSPDGRFAVGDDFSRGLYLVDRRTGEMMLVSTGHKETAADHPHPTFHPDGTRFQIQSALLSADDRSMNICIIPVPEAWLARDHGATSP
jgi:oligogalacturonide lyase